MDILEVSGLSKSFGKKEVLKDLNFSLKQGEIFGFLGPNGAGKTTTINCLMGFLYPDQGTIRIFSKDIKDNIVDIKKDISYGSSSSILNMNWSLQDHINFIYDFKLPSEFDNNIIKTFDVPLYQKIKTLSFGNIQKASLVVSLICNPKLIILDEPSRGLDPLYQNIFHKLIVDIKKRGTTIFLSSHDLSEVSEICTRIGIIKEGELVNIEEIDDIKEKSISSVSIIFKGKYNIEDFKDFQIESNDDTSISLKVKKDINGLIKILSKYDIENISVTPLSLEDIFLEFYK
ncbi:ABC transporter ATP-binding protein [Patescibacteria group bacterium]|nr:ABC transporter ATP-binding protein [Patescibacteria group bacterium]